MLRQAEAVAAAQQVEAEREAERLAREQVGAAVDLGDAGDVEEF